MSDQMTKQSTNRQAGLARAMMGFVALAASLLAVLSPAFAQSTKDRLEALERSVADLNAAAPVATDASLKIGRLEQEVQFLTGRVEELNHALEQANARLDAVSAALAGGALPGFTGLDGGPVPLGGGAPDLQPGDPIADAITSSGAADIDTSDVALPINPEAAFDYASGFLRSGDYARAEAAYLMFVQSFPNNARTADAQFRLGEIYLATNRSADAADAFIAHIRQYPNDPRTAEAHLKLGTAFARLGQNDQACKVFKSVRTRFASAPPAVLQRTDVEMQKINCR